MRISQRAASLAPSETLKISALAKEMQRAGKSVISLSQGEPDFKTPAHICEAAKKAIDDGFHGYTLNPGTVELRQAIVDKLKRDNRLDFSLNEIVVSNGAKQSVGFSLLAVVGKGDEVIIPAPFWVSYPEMVKLAEGTPVIIRSSFENDYKITPEQLENHLTQKTKVLILCSPSNPTGSCYSADELKALAKVLERYPNVLVISDEIYEYISFDAPHVSMLEVAPFLRDRFILINGFSKGFAMTGWRLGYLAASPEIAGAVARIQSQETSGACSISQKAGEEAYTSSLESVQMMLSAFAERRDYMYNALNEIEGVKCFKPGGAFYAFPDISFYLGKHTPDGEKMETSTQLCMYLIEQAGLALVPGDAFGEPNGVRFSYSADMDTLKEGMSRFRKALSGLKK